MCYTWNNILCQLYFKKRKEKVWCLDFGGKRQLSSHLHACLRVSSWPVLSFSFLIWGVEIMAVSSKHFDVSPVPTAQSLHAFTYSKLWVNWSLHTFPGLSANWSQSFGNPSPKHSVYFHDSVPIVYFAWIFFFLNWENFTHSLRPSSNGTYLRILSWCLIWN